MAAATAWCLAVGALAMSGVRPWPPDPPLLGRSDDLVVRLAAVGLVAVGVAIGRWRGQFGGVLIVIGAMATGALLVFESHPAIAAAIGMAGVTLGYALAASAGWGTARRVGAALVMAGGAVALGWTAWWGHGELYGATHPTSPTSAPPDGGVEWVWSGGATPTGATVTAKVASDVQQVGLQTRPPGRVTRFSRDGVHRFEVSGLPAGVAVSYAVVVDDRDDGSGRGTFRTLPRGPASFEVAFSSCARTGSNGRVFDAIRARRPLMFLHMGDMFYANTEGNDPGAFRRAFDRVLTRPAQAALYRSTSTSYVWDDHDFGPNDADRTSASAPAAHAVYREVVPHHDLPVPGAQAPLAQAFTVGRVRFVVTDTRSSRSPADEPDGPTKSILGASQRAWLERELVAARDRGELAVWVSPVSWIGTDRTSDSWSAYARERREIADIIRRERIQALVMLSGDTHAVAIDDGTNSGYATTGGPGFPVIHAGALDRVPQVKDGPYSEGVSAGGGRFGTLRVTDDGGSVITVTLTGWDWRGARLMELRRTFTLPV